MAGSSEIESETECERIVHWKRPLHNFKLPPYLRWGYQKQLRCMKVSPLQNSPDDSNWAFNSTDFSVDHRGNRSIPQMTLPRESFMTTTGRKNVKAKSRINRMISGASVGDATGIEAVREKVMSDLKFAADQLKLPILEGKGKEEKNINKKKPSEEELPWNLRNRRPTIKAKGDNVNVGQRSLGASDETVGNGNGKTKRARFSRTLPKVDVETDFLLMTGDKPPRRPKKRSKAALKHLDVSSKNSLFL